MDLKERLLTLKNSILGDDVDYYEKCGVSIDKDTFEVINYSYAKDKNNIYMIDLYDHRNFGLFVVNFADVNSFEIIEDGDNYIDSLYAKDISSVYYCGEKIEGLPSNNFKFLKNTIGLYDIFICENNLIIEGEVIEGIDYNSLVFVSEKNKKIKLEDCNNESNDLEKIGEILYLKNKNNVYNAHTGLIDE